MQTFESTYTSYDVAYRQPYHMININYKNVVKLGISYFAQLFAFCAHLINICYLQKSITGRINVLIYVRT